MPRPYFSEQRILGFKIPSEDDPNRYPFILAFLFAAIDTVLYFFSENNFLVHIKKAELPITDLKSDNDSYYLSLMAAGGAFTFVGTLAAYHLRIRNYSEYKYPPKPLTNSKIYRALLFFITSLSILNKSWAISTSAFALYNDYFPEEEVDLTSILTSPIFILSLFANILIQMSVQFESIDYKMSLPKWLSKSLGFISTTIYNADLFALYFNTYNNSLNILHQMPPENRIDFKNLFKHDKLLRVIPAIPLFVGGLIHTEIKFVPEVIKRLSGELSDQPDQREREQKSTQSRRGCSKLFAGLCTIQRTLIMLLSWAALIFGFFKGEDDWYKGLGYFCSFALGALLLPGNFVGNLALLYPKSENEEDKSYGIEFLPRDVKHEHENEDVNEHEHHYVELRRQDSNESKPVNEMDFPMTIYSSPINRSGSNNNLNHSINSDESSGSSLP